METNDDKTIGYSFIKCRLCGEVELVRLKTYNHHCRGKESIPMTRIVKEGYITRSGKSHSCPMNPFHRDDSLYIFDILNTNPCDEDFLNNVENISKLNEIKNILNQENKRTTKINDQ